tara:strand:+ start:2618 stop:4402 length:1785 start_codon:yes stop_codon:yes gene_type:complete
MSEIKKISYLFFSKNYNEAIFLVLGFFIVSIIELAGLVSILPFTAIIIDPILISQNTYLNFVYDYFNFSSTDEFIVFSGVCVVILIIFSNFLNALIYWRSHFFVNHQVHTISYRLLKNYTAQKYLFFKSHNVSQLNNNILTQVERVCVGILLPVTIGISKFFTALLIILFLMFINLKVAILSITTFVVSYIIIYNIVKDHLHKIGEKITKDSEYKYKTASEILYGIKDLKINGNIALFLSKFFYPSLSYAKNNSMNAVLSLTPRFFLETLAFAGIIILIITFMLSDIAQSSFIPLLSVYAFAGYKILPALQITYVGFTQARYHMPTLDILLDDLSLKDESYENDKYETLIFKNKIMLEDINFSYDEDPVLKNICLKINKDEKIGFIGKTGSGKTTLLDILLGLLDPSSGEIKIDDEKLENEKIRLWQKKIAFVPQNIFLLDDTILNNIVFSNEEKEINQSRLSSVLRAAQLDSLIDNLELGLNTNIGDHGLRLSGGERQRIGIARALYKDSDLLILDEATNALDRDTENKIINSIMNLNKTVIVVTHRIDITKNLDKIYIIKDKTLFAEGSYNELYNNSPDFRKYMKDLDTKDA